MNTIFLVHNKWYGDESIHFVQAETKEQAAEKYFYSRYDENYVNSLSQEEKEKRINGLLNDYEFHKLESFDKYGVSGTSIYLKEVEDSTEMVIY